MRDANVSKKHLKHTKTERNDVFFQVNPAYKNSCTALAPENSDDSCLSCASSRGGAAV